MTSEWWDEAVSGPPDGDPIQLSDFAQIAIGIGGFSLAGLTLMSCLSALLALKSGDASGSWFAGLAFLFFAVAQSQIRFAIPVSSTKDSLTVSLGLDPVELHPGDIAWAWESPSRMSTSEGWLIVGLKRRRFLGAKWLCTTSDAGGRVKRFVNLHA